MNALKKASKTVKIDLGEIQLVRQMLNNGWFFFQANNGMPRLYFKKTKTYERLRKKPEIEEEEDIPLDNINI